MEKIITKHQKIIFLILPIFIALSFFIVPQKAYAANVSSVYVSSATKTDGTTYNATISNTGVPANDRATYSGLDVNIHPYGVGTIIYINVLLSSSVVTSVSGTPTLTLETGTVDRAASYYSLSSDGRTLTFKYIVQAGDNSSDLNYVSSTSLSGGTIKVGTTTLTITLVNPTSNYSLGYNNSVVIDTTPPTNFSITNPTPPTTQASSKTVSAISLNTDTVSMYMAKTQNTTCNGSGSLSFLAYVPSTSIIFNNESDNGTYVCFAAEDAAGNWAYALSNIVSGIDATPPSVTSITSVAGSTAPPYFDITNDNNTAVVYVASSDAVTCKWGTADTSYDTMTACTSLSSCNLTFAGLGVHTAYMRCLDAAGNKSTSSKVVTYTIDTTLPAVSSITSVAGDNSSPYYDATDDGSTIVNYVATSHVADCHWNTSNVLYNAMAHDCGSSTSCTLNLTGQGSKTVFMRCIDSAGNKGDGVASVYSFLYTIDSIAPVAPGTPVLTTGGSTTTSTTPSFTVSCETGDTVYLYDNGIVASSYYTCSSGSVTAAVSPAISNGTHPITAKQQDTAGNWSSASGVASIVVSVLDTTGPFNVSVSYDTTTTATSSVVITYNYGYDSGSGLNLATGEIRRMVATYSGGVCGSYSYFTDLHFGYNDSPYTDSTVQTGHCYRYQYLIYDNAGNPATTTGGVVIITNTPSVPGAPGAPTLFVDSVTDSEIDLSATASNNGSAITKYEVQRSLDGGNTWENSTTVSGSTFIYQDTDISPLLLGLNNTDEISWLCTGTCGGSKTCTATRTGGTPAYCGTADGQIYDADVTGYGDDTQCEPGSPSSTAFPTAGNSVTWHCNSTDGGEASGDCTASRSESSPGTCNATYDGKNFYELSWSSNLCSAGDVQNFSENDTGWTWDCEGTNNGSTDSCSANLKVDGDCGLAAQSMYVYEYTGTHPGNYITDYDLCYAGTVPTGDVLLPWQGGSTVSWHCGGLNGGSASIECSAYREMPLPEASCKAVSGGEDVPPISPPLSGSWLAKGTGGTGVYSYTWGGDASGNSITSSFNYTTGVGLKTATIVVHSGGFDSLPATCSITVTDGPIDGICGSAATTYRTGDSFPGDNQYCTSGTVCKAGSTCPPEKDPASLGTTTTSWICKGINDGAKDSGTCTATRLKAPTIGTLSFNINNCPSASTSISGASIMGFDWGDYQDTNNAGLLQTGFKLQVSEDPNFNTIIFESTSYHQLYILPSGVQSDNPKISFANPAVPRYWRVKITNVAGDSAWYYGNKNTELIDGSGNHIYNVTTNQDLAASFTTPIHPYPNPKITFSASPVIVKNAVYFSGRDSACYADNGAAIDCLDNWASWALDGSNTYTVSKLNPPAPYTYNTIGTYNQKLKITDAQGYSCTAQEPLTVKASSNIPLWKEISPF